MQCRSSSGWTPKWQNASCKSTPPRTESEICFPWGSTCSHFHPTPVLVLTWLASSALCPVLLAAQSSRPLWHGHSPVSTSCQSLSFSSLIRPAFVWGSRPTLKLLCLIWSAHATPPAAWPCRSPARCTCQFPRTLLLSQILLTRSFSSLATRSGLSWTPVPRQIPLLEKC